MYTSCSSTLGLSDGPYVGAAARAAAAATGRAGEPRAEGLGRFPGGSEAHPGTGRRLRWHGGAATHFRGGGCCDRAAAVHRCALLTRARASAGRLPMGRAGNGAEGGELLLRSYRPMLNANVCFGCPNQIHYSSGVSHIKLHLNISQCLCCARSSH